jgi:hypothetical protein
MAMAMGVIFSIFLMCQIAISYSEILRVVQPVNGSTLNSQKLDVIVEEVIPGQVTHAYSSAKMASHYCFDRFRFTTKIFLAKFVSV